MKTLNTESMTQEQAREWYINSIGYDPFADDPNITLDEVKSVISEYRKETGI